MTNTSVSKKQRKPPNRRTIYTVVSIPAEDRPALNELVGLVRAKLGLPIGIGRVLGIAIREALAKRQKP